MTGTRMLLRESMTQAVKRRDRAATAVLRVALSALDNATAVDAPKGQGSAGALELSLSGAGAADVARRELTEDEQRAILQAQIDELDGQATELAASAPAFADQLRQQASVLRAVLGS